MDKEAEKNLQKELEDIRSDYRQTRILNCISTHLAMFSLGMAVANLIMKILSVK